MDYGCYAPAVVFIEVYRRKGVEISMEEARQPMGAHKLVHIRKISQIPSVARRWRDVHGRTCTEKDVQAMFEEFVRPYLAEQCAQLDYAMYHLDGTNALQHLDILLDMPEIDAIEWTPQAGLPGGGAPEWHDLYRRIKAAGKAVQVVSITPPEVIPLLDAVGPEGVYVLINEPVPAAEAEALMRDLTPYRS